MLNPSCNYICDVITKTAKLKNCKIILTIEELVSDVLPESLPRQPTSVDNIITDNAESLQPIVDEIKLVEQVKEDESLLLITIHKNTRKEGRAAR